MESGSVRIGTSRWQYDDQRVRFYQDGLPKSGRLSSYAERFPAVEVNSPFYRLPSPETFARW